MTRFVSFRGGRDAIARGLGELGATLDALPLPTIAFDAEGRVTLWSKAAEHVFGWSEEEVIGRRNPLVPDEEWQAFQGAVDLVFERGKAWRNVEVPRAAKDGSQIHVSASSGPLRDADGTIVGMLSVIVDVTERRRAEVALRESEQLFRATFDSAPIGAALVAPGGRWLKVNEVLCDLLGYTEEELLQLTFFDVTHPGDLAPSLERHQLLLDGAGDQLRIEKRYLRSDGETVWVAVRSTVVRDAEGVPLYSVALIEDVTARVRTQKALEEAEERFRRAFDDAPIGMALVASEGHFLSVNQTLCEITGYSADELLQRTFQDITHPDDLEADLDQVRRLLAGEARAYQLAKRYCRRDGQVVWVMLSVSLVRDRDGLPLYFVSQMEDISERKSAEQKLQHLADRDPLTGLFNRRKLMEDLELALASGSKAPARLLVIFDLNGFKHYNDSFGHPAGDALLVRLATKLGQAVRVHGEAYRLGGDEFCVLATAAEGEVEAFLAATAAALSEDGDGFSVSSSFGAAFLPEEAADATRALTLVDERLYAQKETLWTATGGEPYEVLIRVLTEREPSLREHVESVAELSASVGSRLGLAGHALEELRLAAALHDIGKLAIPDTLLQKPGVLTEAEWALVRQHTLIGQRILAGAPALRNVGKIARSTHERWDGTGYPDGLAQTQIPLAARIIAVCDAFQAMTADRPYRTAISSDDAVAELRRCAASQFDPDVVRVFCELEMRESISPGARQSAQRSSGTQRT